MIRYVYENYPATDSDTAETESSDDDPEEMRKWIEISKSILTDDEDCDKRSPPENTKSFENVNRSVTTTRQIKRLKEQQRKTSACKRCFCGMFFRNKNCATNHQRKCHSYIIDGEVKNPENSNICKQKHLNKKIRLTDN